MPGKETVSTSETLSPPSGLRLDSWKEIASYLKRSPRTVRRWERHEGLPVHRHLHAKKWTVYTFPHELDAWLGGRRMTERADQLTPGHAPHAATLPASGAGRKDRRNPPVVIATLPLRNLGGAPEQELFAEVPKGQGGDYNWRVAAVFSVRSRGGQRGGMRCMARSQLVRAFRHTAAPKPRVELMGKGVNRPFL